MIFSRLPMYSKLCPICVEGLTTNVCFQPCNDRINVAYFSLSLSQRPNNLYRKLSFEPIYNCLRYNVASGLCLLYQKLLHTAREDYKKQKKISFAQRFLHPSETRRMLGQRIKRVQKFLKTTRSSTIIHL